MEQQNYINPDDFRHYKEQIERETEQASRKYSDFIGACQRNVAHSPAGIKAIATYVERLAAFIAEDVDKQGQASKVALGSNALVWREDRYKPWNLILGADQLAYITLKTIMQNLGDSKPAIASKVASTVFTEYELEQSLALNTKGYAKVVGTSISKTAKAKDRVKSAQKQIAKKTAEIRVVDSDSKKAAGLRLYELAEACTGLFVSTLSKMGKRRQPIAVIQPTEAFIEFQGKYNSIVATLSKVFPALLIPPKPWTNWNDGAYYSKEYSGLTMIKAQRQDLIKAAFEGSKINPAITALNAIQNVPFRINSKVLEVVQWAWSHNMQVNGMPDRIGKDLAGLTGRDLGRAVSFNKSADRASQVRFTQLQLDEAGFLSQFDKHWHAHQMDFRGREYALTSYFNLQSSKLGRGLMEFAEGEEMTEDAAIWLAIHGANTWANDGLDKTDYNTRYAWVLDNEENILAVADAPTDNLWWIHADGGDNAFQFLQFCIDWAGWLRNGTSHVSHTVCYADGSCNGIQHYSAMLRDDKAGELVNLMDTDTPNDIYNEVSVEAARLSAIDAAMGDKSAVFMLKKWSRSLVKRAVMTTAYSVTAFGIRDQLLYEQGKLWEEVELQGMDKMDVLRHLEACISKAIAKVIVGAKVGMSFIKEVAREVGSAAPIVWTTFDGLPIVQEYRERTYKKILTTMSGALKYKEQVQKHSTMTIAKETNKIDASKQALAIAPNVIHSLDATHLRMTVLAMLEEGIENFAFVHDSYGVHATNFMRMNQLLREQFAILHGQDKTALQDWAEQVGSNKTAPIVGDLDIKKVLQADYFFA